ncbi:2896_t:CDS:1, partial [Rhizophagus irregularis]
SFEYEFVKRIRRYTKIYDVNDQHGIFFIHVVSPTENWSVGCNLSLDAMQSLETSISQTKDISTNTHFIVMGH